MSVPTLENGPWVFNVNNTFADATYTNVTRWALWKIKDVLASFSEWTVVASTDGTTVSNIGDGGDVDHWDVYTDVVTNSWVILENSVTGEQFCIYNSSATSQIINIYWSATGDFGVNGTTSAVPSASEKVDIASSYFTGESGSLDSVSVSGMISADGKCTRIFVRQRRASTYFGGQLILLEELKDTPSQWTSTHKRCVLMLENSRFSTTGTLQGPLLAYLGGNVFNCYLEDAEPSAGHCLGYATSECYGPNMGGGSGGYPVSNLATSVDWVTGAIAGAIGVFNADIDHGGYLGRFQDIFWAPNGHNSLDTYPSGGSRAWIKFGCFLVPWNGSVPSEAP